MGARIGNFGHAEGNDNIIIVNERNFEVQRQQNRHLDPISLNPMRKTVVIACGHSFNDDAEQPNLTTWVGANGTCPTCGDPVGNFVAKNYYANELYAETIELAKKVDDLQSDVEKYVSKNERLEDMYLNNNRGANVSDLANIVKLRQLSNDVNNLSEKVDKYKAKSENLNKTNRKLYEKSIELEINYKEVFKKNIDLEKSFNEVCEKNEKIKGDKIQLKLQNAQLEMITKYQQADKIKLKEESDALKKNYADLEVSKTDLQFEMFVLQRNKDKIEREKSEVELENSILKADKVSLEAKVESLSLENSVLKKDKLDLEGDRLNLIEIVEQNEKDRKAMLKIIQSSDESYKKTSNSR